jgi:hypothetical protein
MITSPSIPVSEKLPSTASHHRTIWGVKKVRRSGAVVPGVAPATAETIAHVEPAQVMFCTSPRE